MQYEILIAISSENENNNYYIICLSKIVNIEMKLNRIIQIIFYQMKNRKLYESIQKLVTKKQQKKANKANFAQQYCNQHLRRKKLIPKLSTYKIDQIMQNFKKIETFINVDQLIGCVNEIYLEEDKANEKQLANNREKRSTHKKYASQIFDQKVLGRAKLALRQYHKDLYELQNYSINPILNQLQHNSNFFNDIIQNKQKQFIYDSILRTDRKINKQVERPVQNWNHYRLSSNIIKTQPNQQNLEFISNQKKNYTPFDAYKKKKKLFNLAQIYLHMILEENHRKKWNKNKKTNVSQKIKKLKFQENKQKQNIQKQLFSAIEKDLKLEQENTQFKHKQQENSTGSTWTIRAQAPHKLKTKIIKNKETVMKKMNNFLLNLEQDDQCLKKQNKQHMRHLYELQKHIGEDKASNFNERKIWDDEEKCQQINKILYRQIPYKN